MEFVKGDRMREERRRVSALVSFRRNTKISVEEAGWRKGRTGFTSKYIGFFQDGRRGMVFPGNSIVEGVIEEKEKKGPEPWFLQVFTQEREGIFIAFSIDDLHPPQEQPPPPDQLLLEEAQKRLDEIEKKMQEIESGMNELKSRVLLREP